MACPEKFQFANEFGILRKEGVFSTINVNRIVENSEDCACRQKVARLKLCESISKNCQKGLTTTLIDADSGEEFCIEAGTRLHQVLVVDRTCGNLQCELSFMLGAISDCVDDDARLAEMAQRWAPMDKQITGNTLNALGGVISLVEGVVLNGSSLASYKALIDAEMLANGEDVLDADLGIIYGNNAVGEPIEIKPAITVTSGEVCKDDLDFYICYTPPCEGYVWKPVVMMEPCSQKSCGLPSSPCSSPKFGMNMKGGYRRNGGGKSCNSCGH